jgi:hypothetical protein
LSTSFPFFSNEIGDLFAMLLNLPRPKHSSSMDTCVAHLNKGNDQIQEH